MSRSLEKRCRDLVCELGLSEADQNVSVSPLAGGVASDIARVDVAGKSFCVKFALEKLKVAEDWRAPVRRNKAEYAWLEFAAEIEPRSVPRLFGRAGGGFAMEFVSSPDVRLWKNALLQEPPRMQHAKSVANALGRIHAASTRPGFRAEAFRNNDDFAMLRIDPYLLFTARRHPRLERPLSMLADSLYRSRTALVHGDVSPKNILFRGRQPLFLDAECATMGDPAFDAAFCLNHLILKSVHRPGFGAELIGAAETFWDAYASHVSWESSSELERRAANLLPALMLARVDGKSPVEYLSELDRDRVRKLAIPLVSTGPRKVSDVLRAAERQRDIGND